MKNKHSINTMPYSIADNLRKLQHCVGTVKTRSMFGGYGLFLNEIFFGYFTNEKLHFRAGEHTKSTFEALNIAPHTYFKRSHWVITNYYPVPEEWLNNLPELKKHAIIAISEAQEDMKTKPNKNKATDRIKDLPNLKWSTESLLRTINIHTVSQLKENGSINTFTSLAKAAKKDIDIKMLFMLEGAITGQHWSVLPCERRNELISALPKHITCNYQLERA